MFDTFQSIGDSPFLGCLSSTYLHSSLSYLNPYYIPNRYIYYINETDKIIYNGLLPIVFPLPRYVCNQRSVPPQSAPDLHSNFPEKHICTYVRTYKATESIKQTEMHKRKLTDRLHGRGQHLQGRKSVSVGWIGFVCMIWMILYRYDVWWSGVGTSGEDWVSLQTGSGGYFVYFVLGLLITVCCLSI